jgi:peptidoglycan/LPS O-acetylase OafA/YrhL
MEEYGRARARGPMGEMRMQTSNASAPAARAATAPDGHGRGRYMPGLDGLRALAVAAVIAYHLDVPWTAGGLLGVAVFFVLSGYLITDLLVAAYDATDRIQLGDFWARRARRLLPALFLMLAAVVTWVTLVDPSRMAGLRGDVLAAVLYVSNWWLIFHHVSYFASFGPPSPLGHLWSLAVEEQFYLCWPLLLWVGLRRVPKRSVLCALVALLAAASAIAMAVLYHPGTDPSRVYYGTDTRAFGLLIGAGLALVWPSRRLSTALPRLGTLVLDAVGAVGLAVVLAMIVGVGQDSPFLYRGGLVLVSLASAALVAALAHPASRIARLFALRPLRWLGERSYGIYLWHYPVILLTTPVVEPQPSLLRGVVQVAATVAIAALSYRYVEVPIRRGALDRLWQHLHRGALMSSDRAGILAAGALGTAIVLAVSVGGLSGLAPAAASSPAETVSQIVPAALKRHVHATVPPGSGDAPRSVSGSPYGHDLPGRFAGPVPVRGPASDDPRPAGAAGPSHAARSRHHAIAAHHRPSCHGVSAIGDSVMIDAAPYLRQMLPGIVIDAQVGRQLYRSQPVVEALRSHHELGGCVIIELGTNGPFTRDQLVSLLRALGPVRRILLVNTRVPRSWQGEVNTMLASVAARFPHAVLVNWYRASAGHPGYFWPDGVHLDPTGARAYAEMVVNALRRSLR